jgi:hypothetical protein
LWDSVRVDFQMAGFPPNHSHRYRLFHTTTTVACDLCEHWQWGRFFAALLVTHLANQIWSKWHLAASTRATEMSWTRHNTWT